MSAKQMTSGLQDRFLNQLRKSKTHVAIFLSNGFQLKDAVILGFDAFVLILHTGGKQMMLYKHAISSITPFETIEFPMEAEKGNNDD